MGTGDKWGRDGDKAMDRDGDGCGERQTWGQGWDRRGDGDRGKEGTDFRAKLWGQGTCRGRDGDRDGDMDMGWGQIWGQMWGEADIGTGGGKQGTDYRAKLGGQGTNGSRDGDRDGDGRSRGDVPRR